MSDKKYTPGPWNYAGHHPHAHHIITIQAKWKGHHTQLAELCTSVFGNEETSANAQLIAAAPDMLEALHSLYDVVWDNSESIKTEVSASIFSILNKAIAKAEGGQL